MYLLQIWQGRLVGFQYMMPLLSSNRNSTALIAVGAIYHIVGPKYDKVPSPLNTVFTIIGKLNLEGFLHSHIVSISFIMVK